MSGRKIFILTHMSDKKSKFRISRGMKPTTRNGDFFRLFSFQDLIIGLISTTVIFFYGLSVRQQFDITIYLLQYKID